MKDTNMQKALSFIKDKKFSFSIDFNETISRFDRNGKQGNAWAIGKTIAMEDKTIQALYFGDFATGEKWQWFSEEAMTEKEIASLKAAVQKASTEYKARRLKEQTEACAKVEALWNRCTGISIEGLPNQSAYILRKQIEGNYGARLDTKQNLYVPMRDTKGKLWNVQRIAPDGTKRFYPKARLIGTFHTIGEISPEGVIYVCEGYATGVSIFKACEYGYKNTRSTGMECMDRPEPESMGEIREVCSPVETGEPKARSSNEYGSSRTVGASMVTDDRRGALGGRESPTFGGRKSQDGAPDTPSSTSDVPSKEGSIVSTDDALQGTSNGHSAIKQAGSRRPTSMGEGLEPTQESRQIRPLYQGGDGSHGTRYAVCVAFSAGNLSHTAQALRKEYPLANIILCADNDAFTKDVNGNPHNPGIEKATAAAQMVSGSVRFPHFEEGRHSANHRYTDYNDLHVFEGLDACFASLTAESQRDTREDLRASQNASLNSEVEKEHTTEKIEKEFSSLVVFSDKGKPILPLHKTIVSRLLDFYGENICKQDKTLFVYTGTYWKEVNDFAEDNIKLQIQSLYGKYAEEQLIEKAFKLFVLNVEHAPATVNMFTTNPTMINFLNGTLHVIQEKRDFRLEFKPHNRLDYLINVLSFNYSENLSDNSEFLIMLERVFEGDHDKDEKIRAVKQMYGASLVPIFPRLFLLYGPPGTGKSTVIRLAKRLINEDNSCSVSPDLFKGFHLEIMAGKMINYDTDINTVTPINDSMVKKIEDRHIFTINRKNKKMIKAPLPAIHLFGGNNLPKTMESDTHAYERRWTFIGFDKMLQSMERDYEEFCFNKNPEGILKFALEGLKDLLAARGTFFNPQSGKDKMVEWNSDHDIVEQFFEAIRENELPDNNNTIIIDKDARIERIKLWDMFVYWMKHSTPDERIPKKNEVYKRLYKKGITIKVVRGTYYFCGVGLKIEPGALF